MWPGLYLVIHITSAGEAGDGSVGDMTGDTGTDGGLGV